MKNILMIMISLLFFFNAEDVLSQEKAAISGTVFIPDISRAKRAFRGKVYRNRLSSHDSKPAEIKSASSAFSDVIISAHPLSYVLDVDSLPPVYIMQINAEFSPRVVAVTPGTEILFINKDNFFHNVFSITPGARFNIGRKPTGEIERRKIQQTGEIKLFCDIHAQMNATVLCIDTPYFTRLENDRSYTIANLPAGSYEIRVFHPDLTAVHEHVELQPGKQLIKNFTLSR